MAESVLDNMSNPTYTNEDAYSQSVIDEVEKPQLTAENTVEGRLGSMLDANSDLMKRAKSFGDLQAQERGALGSSMGARAAQSALYDAAIPIATADAQTAAAFDQLGFDYQSELGKMNESQKLRMEELDKANSLSKDLLKDQYAFKEWSMERGWDEAATSDMLKMYSTIGSTAMKAMAAIASSAEATTAEGEDLMNAWKDINDSLAAISGLDITFEETV